MPSLGGLIRVARAYCTCHGRCSIPTSAPLGVFARAYSGAPGPALELRRRRNWLRRLESRTS